LGTGEEPFQRLTPFQDQRFRSRHFANRDIPHNRRQNRPRFRLHRPPVHCGANRQAALDLSVKIADCNHRPDTIGLSRRTIDITAFISSIKNAQNARKMRAKNAIFHAYFALRRP
jgi:hypothetical protein